MDFGVKGGNDWRCPTDRVDIAQILAWVESAAGSVPQQA